MSEFNKPALSAVSLVFATLLAAQSAQADGLNATFDYRIVELDAAGEETLIERETVRPGEMIHYTLTHENATDYDLSDLMLSGPIPDGVVLALDTQTSSEAAKFEVQAEMDIEQDGLEWSMMPALRKVIAEDGSETLEPVPAADIVAVRWILDAPLKAGTSALNSYRVVVE